MSSNSSRKVIGSIIGIVVFIICLLSLSYAWYKWRSANSNVDIGIHEGGLKFVYSNNNILTSNTLSPVLDYTDSSYYENNNSSLVYADYTTTNTTTDTYKMIVKLNITSISDALVDSSFKWVLLEKESTSYSKVVSTGNFADLVVGSNTINEGVYVSPSDTSIDYRFVIYIDGNMENSSGMMNSSLVSNLELCDEKVDIFNITLDNQGATSGQEGTGRIYEKYNVGIYKDSTASTTLMTTTSNNITVPGKTGYTFGGYYTGSNGSGDQLITASGYITNKFTNTYFSGNATLYALWLVNKPTTSYCSSPTYNGSSQVITNDASSGYTFSGNTGTNATSYTVTAKLDSGKKWSDGTTNDVTFSCSILKRDVTYKADSASKVYDSTALTKQTATLTSGSLVSGHTATFSITGTITNVGSVTNTLNSVTIKSGSTDVSSNYNITKQNGTLTVTSMGVDKPTTSYCSNPTYNGDSQTITKTAGTGYTFSGNTGTNATSYTVTAKLSNNYKWSDDTTADVTFSCSISKRDVTYKADSASKVYNGTALTKQTATLTSGTLVSGHTATFSITGTITNVGSVTNTLNSVTIKSGSTDVSSNYNITKQNGTLTVTSMGVDKPTTSYCSNPTYNGDSQTITKAAGTGYTFSGNTGTNATSYTVTAKLSSNYKWSDDTTADVTFSCSILKRDVTYKADSASKVYNGTALTKQTATLTSGSLVSGHTATFSITGTITNVGSVTNTLNSVTIKSGSTDVSSNYNITKQNGTLTVTSKSVDKPTTSYCSNPTYNGDSQTITTAAGTGYTFSGNTGIDAGSYTVTAELLSNNYKWSDDTTDNVTFSCSILRKDIVDSMITIRPTSYIYDGTAKTPNVTLTDGDYTTGIGGPAFTVSYSDNINAGTATVTVTGIGNYKGTVNKTFTISYNTFSITLDNVDATTAGTTTLYARYLDGIYLDNGYTQKTSTTENPITVPFKTGYTFEGYYSGEDGSGDLLIDAGGYITDNFTNIYFDSTSTIYARWSAKEITIRYNANGGTGTMEDTTYVYNGGGVTLPANTYTRTGFNFEHWRIYREYDDKWYGCTDDSVACTGSAGNTTIGWHSQEEIALYYTPYGSTWVWGSGISGYDMIFYAQWTRTFTCTPGQNVTYAGKSWYVINNQGDATQDDGTNVCEMILNSQSTITGSRNAVSGTVLPTVGQLDSTKAGILDKSYLISGGADYNATMAAEMKAGLLYTFSSSNSYINSNYGTLGTRPSGTYWIASGMVYTSVEHKGYERGVIKEVFHGSYRHDTNWSGGDVTYTGVTFDSNRTELVYTSVASYSEILAKTEVSVNNSSASLTVTNGKYTYSVADLNSAEEKASLYYTYYFALSSTSSTVKIQRLSQGASNTATTNSAYRFNLVPCGGSADYSGKSSYRFQAAGASKYTYSNLITGNSITGTFKGAEPGIVIAGKAASTETTSNGKSIKTYNHYSDSNCTTFKTYTISNASVDIHYRPHIKVKMK